jgi:tetratricopeptide (TPR) repeat protein
MIGILLNFFLAFFIFLINLNISSIGLKNYDQRLICVNNYIRYFSFGLENSIVDGFWILFLQELDAYNQAEIAEPHLCPDRTSSWHFHIMNVAFDLDSRFYEIMTHAPLLISVTINDPKGASVLFDKSVANFPNDWRILYRASYQAQIEERNFQKAANLLYRAGKSGAPGWVMSLAGGLYNQVGNRKMAEQIYEELIKESKDEETAQRLKLKLENKLKNYFDAASKTSIPKKEKDKQ